MRSALTAKKGGTKRFAPESQQEQVSLDQIRTWLKGWNRGCYEKDLGEDLVVQIYDGADSSGLSLQIQAKSTTALKTLLKKARAKDAKVPCRLDVKDLVHWEDTTNPVFVVLWDVVLKKGLWYDVPAIISGLDTDAIGWRDQETVTVGMPVTNRTDAAGRRLLRTRAAILALPLFAHKKLEVSLECRFPNTEEGKAASSALRAALDEGVPTTVRREHIFSFRKSPWWDRLFGEHGKPDSFTIGSSEKDVRVTFVLAAIAADCSETLPIELKRKRAGLKKAVFDNAHDVGCNVRLSLEVEDLPDGAAKVHCNIGFKLLTKRLPESLRLVRFFKALYCGARVMLCMPDGTPFQGQTGITVSPLPDLEELQVCEDVLTKLTFIQANVGPAKGFDLSQGISDEARSVVDDVHAHFAQGWWEHHPDTITIPLKAPLTKAGAAKIGKDGWKLHFEFCEYGYNLFGVDIALGTVRAEVTNDDAVHTAFEEAVRTRSRELTIRDPRMVLKVIRASEPPLLPGSPRKKRSARKPPRRN